MGINLNALGYQGTRAAVNGSYETLPPDAYTCVIVNARFDTSQAGNQKLVFYVDIAEGEHSGYFKRFADSHSDHSWAPKAICHQGITLNGRLNPYFKGLLECIENSNPDYHVNADNFEPRDIIGKKCGFVFGEEEYLDKKNNAVRKNIYIAYPIAVSNIANGNFKIPELKKLDDKNKPQPQPTNKAADDYYYNNSAIDDSDVPF